MKNGNAVPKTSRSLADFAVAKRRERCAACQLPDTVRAELKTASDKKIQRDWVVEWLTEQGFTVTSQDITSHNNGKHS